jgi:hypothetical protein
VPCRGVAWSHKASYSRFKAGAPSLALSQIGRGEIPLPAKLLYFATAGALIASVRSVGARALVWGCVEAIAERKTTSRYQASWPPEVRS